MSLSAVVRFRAEPGETGFAERAQAALAVLAGREGWLGGQVGRATDDPGLWVVTTRWASVGSYRRALSSYDVKLAVHPLLYEALDEPTAFEELVVVAADGAVRTAASDREED